MRLQRPTFVFAALVLASTMAFGLGGHFAAESIIRRQQAHQLDELTEVVLRRAEFAIDFAGASLGELARRDLADCGPATLQGSASTSTSVPQSRMCASLTLMAR